jgi:hypothetical protein
MLAVPRRLDARTYGSVAGADSACLGAGDVLGRAGPRDGAHWGGRGLGRRVRGRRGAARSGPNHFTGATFEIHLLQNFV